MKWHMRPDGVLTTCEALRLHHAQATQASPSHIVLDLAAILSVPARASDNNADVCPSFFAGDNELALGTCPACAGRHRPHKYAEGSNNNKYQVASGASLPSTTPTVPVVSPDHVLSGQPPEEDVQHPNATTSDDPRPPGLEPPTGVVSDVSVPRERPGEICRTKGMRRCSANKSVSSEEPCRTVDIASHTLSYVTSTVQTSNFQLASARGYS